MAVRASTGTVFILAENLVLSAALHPLLRVSGYEIKEFQCLADFLDHTAPEAPCCLLIEFSLPGLNPANLQMILAERGIPIPFIFMMASPDTSGTVAAMKAGAFSVVAAPFDPKKMLLEVDSALVRSEDSLYRLNEIDALRQRFGSLTAREAGIIPLVASGKPNKQIAADLGIEQSTVKVHRSRVMRKMGAQSAAQLALMAAKLNLVPAAVSKTRPQQRQQRIRN